MTKKRKSTKGNHKDNSKNDKGAKRGTRSSSRKSKQSFDDQPADDYKLRASVEKDGLTVIDMNADGNCLFRALSDQLYGDYGNCHDEIRHEICNFMEENQDDFKLFLVLDDDDCSEGDDAKDFASYIRLMRQDGEWGGNLELVAAARLYQRDITVFSATLSAFTIECGAAKTAGQDLLVSFHDDDHYNSVRNEKAPPKPTAKRRVGKEQSSSDSQPGETTDSLDSASSTVSSSMSELSVQDPKESKKAASKPVKKRDPCPCGSGLRYGKCCSRKDKQAARMQKQTGKGLQEPPENQKTEQEVTMKGNFRVLQI